MDVLVLQTDVKWLDAGFNLTQAAKMIEEGCSGEFSADLIVLPEMFATGFCMEPERCAGVGGTVTEWMRTIACRYDSAVAGTIAAKVADGYRNRFLFVRPDGVTTHYDKRHLFTFSTENERYDPGTRRVAVRWRGFDILLQTCYDLRFPVFSRNTDGYHLAVYCANWAQARIEVWDTLLRARAMENVCYVIGSNRVGEDPSASYPGRSVVVDYKGNAIARAVDNECGYVKCRLSLEELQRFREKFPALEDADEFVLA